MTELKKLVHGQRVERERSSAPQVVEQPITYYQPDITYPVAHAAKGADEFQTPEEYVEEAVSFERRGTPDDSEGFGEEPGQAFARPPRN